MILLDVDDFILDGSNDEMKKKRSELEKSSSIGRWVVGEGDFIGRHLRQADGKIVVDQEGYILENVRPVTLPRGRRGDPEALASPSEKSAFTTLVYQLNWVGKETRPEVAGSASLLASKVKEPTFKDVAEANAAANLLRSSAAKKIAVRPILPENLLFSVVSDSAGASSANGERAQGA